MFPAVWSRIEQGARRILPLATALLFILIGVVAWPIPYLGAVAPSLGLVAVYYWAIHRPDLFHLPSVFLLGVLQDAIHFLPLGLSALVFVAVHQLALSQRRFFAGHAFHMLWTGFAIVAVAAMLCNWLILSLYNGHGVAFLPVLLQTALTVILFPLPAWVLIRLHRAALSQG